MMEHTTIGRSFVFVLRPIPGEKLIVVITVVIMMLPMHADVQVCQWVQRGRPKEIERINEKFLNLRLAVREECIEKKSRAPTGTS
jgi:hypothetical protein